MKTLGALAGMILLVTVALISFPAGSAFAGPHHPGSGTHGYKAHIGPKFHGGSHHVRRARYYRTGGYYVAGTDCWVINRYINADGYEVIVRQCNDGRVYRIVLE
jgi:hypothetical protein